MPTHETFQFQGDPMTSPINDTHDMAIARCLALQALVREREGLVADGETHAARINENVSRNFEKLKIAERELREIHWELSRLTGCATSGHNAVTMVEALKSNLERERDAATQRSLELSAKIAAKNEALDRARQRGDLNRDRTRDAWRAWGELVAALGVKPSNSGMSQAEVLARIEQLKDAAADFEEEPKAVLVPDYQTSLAAWDTILGAMRESANSTYEEQARAIFKELREVIGVRENDGISITDHVREVMRQRDLALADFKRKVETLASAEAQAEYAIVKRSQLVAAVHAVYYGAHWLPGDSMSVERADELWANLRDAAGFEPGHSPPI